MNVNWKWFIIGLLVGQFLLPMILGAFTARRG